jgi:hypothetical protein
MAKRKSNAPTFQDPITGARYRSDTIVEGIFGSSGSYSSSWEHGKYEIEVSPKVIAYTQLLYDPKFGGSASRIDVTRVAVIGAFKISKAGTISGTSSRVETANAQYDPSTSYLHETTSSGTTKNAFISNRLWECIDPASLTQGIRLDSSLFPSGWWQNPFEPNIV